MYSGVVALILRENSDNIDNMFPPLFIKCTESHRGRKGQTETEKETDGRQTGGRREPETVRQTDRQMKRQTGRLKKRMRKRQTERLRK